MSGYASKSEAMDLLKMTIANGIEDLPTNPRAYYLSRVFSDTFDYRGSMMGWSLTTEGFTEQGIASILRRHLRAKYAQ